MSRRILVRAPDPHRAPPVSTATRRDLFGTMGAMLLLTAAEAGTAKAAELDGELLAACADYTDVTRLYARNDSATEEEADARYSIRCDAIARVTSLSPRTPEGLRAKADVLRAALEMDVPDMLAETFEDCAQPYHLLAMSLCRDVLGRAGA